MAVLFLQQLTISSSEMLGYRQKITSHHCFTVTCYELSNISLLSGCPMHTSAVLPKRNKILFVELSPFLVSLQVLNNKNDSHKN